MSNRLFWILSGIFIAAKMALVGWWPFLALLNMPHDATLFLSGAISLLNGEWLGDYSEFTLMKGPVTSIWIALTNFLGVPLLFSHHVLYIVSCVLCMLAFRRFTNSNGYLLFVLVLLLFIPFSYNYGPIAAAFREMLHQPVVLGMLSVLIILFVDFVKHRRVSIGLAILLGVFLFLFWNNREEGEWVVPLLVWLFLAMVFYTWTQWGENNRTTVIRLAQVVLIPCSIWWLGTIGVAWKNYEQYGVFAVVELKTPEFKRAFGGLIGIEAESWHASFAAQPDVLDKLYSLPSGSELDLDRKHNQSRTPIPSYLLPWTFRSAVRNAGYYKQGGAAVLEFYDRLGREIEAACEREQFTCKRPMLGMLPPWHPQYTAGFLKHFVRIYQKSVHNEHSMNIEDFNSIGTASNFLSVSRLVNSPIRVNETGEHLLPEFYLRMKKNKTRYLVKLQELYRSIAPILFWLAAAGLLVRFIGVVKERRMTELDIVYIGIAGTLLVQLVMFTLLSITEYSQASRLFVIFYPAMYIFIAIGLLSLSRDIGNVVRSIRKRSV